jgi:hypothetical protein
MHPQGFPRETPFGQIKKTDNTKIVVADIRIAIDRYRDAPHVDDAAQRAGDRGRQGRRTGAGE